MAPQVLAMFCTDMRENEAKFVASGRFFCIGGMNIVTRVTRRSEEAGGLDRINTSEFFEQVFQTPGRVEPRVALILCGLKISVMIHLQRQYWSSIMPPLTKQEIVAQDI